MACTLSVQIMVPPTHTYRHTVTQTRRDTCIHVCAQAYMTLCASARFLPFAQFGDTALLLAAMGGNVDLVRLILLNEVNSVSV